MGRRIAVLLAAAGLVAAIGWPTAAFGYGPIKHLSLGVGSSFVDRCGSTVVDGSGFAPGELVTVALQLDPVTQDSTTTDSTGSFSITLRIPPGTDPGTYTVSSNGTTGDSATTDLTVGAEGCDRALLLSRSSVSPGGSTVATGVGCLPGAQVVLFIAGQEVAETTADSQGAFSGLLNAPDHGAGQLSVTASCGSIELATLLSVVATSSSISAPAAGAAVFGVFVLLGIILLRGLFGTGATRRRRKRRGVSDVVGGG